MQQYNSKSANDEAAYFVANNAQTGVAMTAAAGFAATTPFIILSNNDAVGGKNIWLDYIDLVTTAAGSAASGLTTIQAALYLDNTLRYSSAGTDISSKIVSPNMAVSPTSIAKAYAGAITAAAASGSVRPVCGLRTLRPCVSGTVADVVGEMKHFTFDGGSLPSGSVTVANAGVIHVPMPPVKIGPQMSALLYIFYAAAGTPVAASYAPELGWVER
jgi:hypothetical protein